MKRMPVGRLIVLFVLILLLAALVVPGWIDGSYRVKHAREDVLKEDLYSIRTAIDQFTQDRDRCPESLQDLVSHGYLRTIPNDPFTNSKTSWEPVYDDSISGLDNSPKPRNQTQCIVDVHSGSKDTGSDGTHYDQW